MCICALIVVQPHNPLQDRRKRVPLPQEYLLCVNTAAIATSAGFIVIVAISAKAVGGGVGAVVRGSICLS